MSNIADNNSGYASSNFSVKNQNLNDLAFFSGSIALICLVAQGLILAYSPHPLSFVVSQTAPALIIPFATSLLVCTAALCGRKKDPSAQLGIVQNQIRNLDPIRYSVEIQSI